MILEVKTIEIERVSLRAKKTKKVIVYQCDNCFKLYEAKYQKKYLDNRQYHFCSISCSTESRKINGKLCNNIQKSRNNEEWQKKLKETVSKKYGVNNVSSLEWVKKKKISTTRKNYGVDNPQQNQNIKNRTIQTYCEKHSNTWMSKPEKDFRIFLEKKFGKENIKVQQLIENKWSVDFYIISLDTYVQFDGVYWHGLDRNLEEIKSSEKIRDKAIYNKWVKDRQLDEYILKHGKKLVRITDKMFNLDPQICFERIIE